MTAAMRKQLARKVFAERVKWARIFGLATLAFLIMLTYAIIRPPVESLFIQQYTSKALPLAWLLVAVTMFLVVGIYGKIVSRFDLLRLLGLASLASGLIFAVLLIAFERGWRGAGYALYVWKDVYIVLLVEMYYSFANSVFPIKTARWAYGFFGLLAAASGMLGNLVVGSLAVKFGSVNTVFLSIPPLALVFVFCLLFARFVGLGAPLEGKKEGGLIASIRVMRASSYLTLIFAMVVLLQLVMTFADFGFNLALETAFADTNERTQALGRVYAAVNVCSFILQGLNGVILKIFGAPVVAILIPMLITAGLSYYSLFPAFAVIAFVKISGKSLDYTFFRNTKEIFYIPLSYEEKTLGKSAVDMLGLRLAKGGAALIMSLLVAVGIDRVFVWLALALSIAWAIVAVVLSRRFRKKVSRSEELAG